MTDDPRPFTCAVCGLHKREVGPPWACYPCRKASLFSRPLGQSAPPSVRCCADGCRKWTSGGKPYCLHHVDRMPYVLALLARMDSARQEAK